VESSRPLGHQVAPDQSVEPRPVTVAPGLLDVLEQSRRLDLHDLRRERPVVLGRLRRRQLDSSGALRGLRALLGPGPLVRPPERRAAREPKVRDNPPDDDQNPEAVAKPRDLEQQVEPDERPVAAPATPSAFATAAEPGASAAG